MNKQLKKDVKQLQETVNDLTSMLGIMCDGEKGFLDDGLLMRIRTELSQNQYKISNLERKVEILTKIIKLMNNAVQKR